MISSELMEAQDPVCPQTSLQWAVQTCPLPAAQVQPEPGPVSGTPFPSRPSATAAVALALGPWGGPSSGPAG